MEDYLIAAGGGLLFKLSLATSHRTPPQVETSSSPSAMDNGGGGGGCWADITAMKFLGTEPEIIICPDLIIRVISTSPSFVSVRRRRDGQSDRLIDIDLVVAVEDSPDVMNHVDPFDGAANVKPTEGDNATCRPRTEATTTTDQQQQQQDTRSGLSNPTPSAHPHLCERELTAASLSSLLRDVVVDLNDHRQYSMPQHRNAILRANASVDRHQLTPLSDRSGPNHVDAPRPLRYQQTALWLVHPRNSVATAHLLPSDMGVAWWALGRSLDKDETIRVGEKRVGRIECFLEAIRLDDRNSKAWYNIGCLLGESTSTDGGTNSDRTVRIHQRDYGKLDCFVETVRADPKNVNGWVNLGRELANRDSPFSAGDGLDFHGGGACVGNRVVNFLECFQEAVLADRRNDFAWLTLGRNLPEGLTANIVDRTCTAKDCYVESLSLKCECSEAWDRLADVMHGHERVNIEGRGRYSQVDCLVAALDFSDAKSASLWERLGDCLSSSAQSTSSDGERVVSRKVLNEIVDKPTCYVRAIHLNKLEGLLWTKLGYCMPDYDGTSTDASRHASLGFLDRPFNGDDDGRPPLVRLDGMVVTKRDCVVKAVELDPDNDAAWLNLAEWLKQISSDPQQRKFVTLHKGSEGGVELSVVTRVDCLNEVLRIAPNAETWAELGEALSPGSCEEAIVAGRPYNRFGCFVQCLALDDQRRDIWSQLGLEWRLYAPASRTMVEIGANMVSKRACFINALRGGTLDAAAAATAWYGLGLALASQTDVVHIEQPPSITLEMDTGSSSNRTPAAAYTRQQCYAAAIELNPRLDEAWHSLGLLLASSPPSHSSSSSTPSALAPPPPAVSCEMLGRRYSQLECLLKAVQLAPGKARYWADLANAVTNEQTTIPVLLPRPGDDKAHHHHSPPPPTSYSKIDCYVKSLSLDVAQSQAWTSLGMCLAASTRRPLGNPINTKAQQNFPAVAVTVQRPSSSSSSPRDSSAAAADGGADGAAVVRVNGRPMTKRDCYIEAIHYDPANVKAWNNLGAVLLPTEEVVVTVPTTGTTAPRSGAGAAAAAPDGPRDSDATSRRAPGREASPVVTANRGGGESGGDVERSSIMMTERRVDKLGCFAEAVRLQRNNGVAWTNLGCTLGDGEFATPFAMPRTAAAQYSTTTTIVVTSRPQAVAQRFDRKDCFVEALEHDATQPHAWTNLGTCLTDNRTTVRVRARDFNKQQCYVEALKINPDFRDAWNNLGETLAQSAGGSASSASANVRIGSRTFTEQDCYIEALRIDATHSPAWRNLASSLNSAKKRSVCVGGATYSREECYDQARRYELANENGPPLR